MLTLVAFIVVFGVLVFVHELGHFLGAKIFGVKVQEFAFGFPPRLWSKKKGDTLYSVNALPLGGYVKMLGEEGEISKDPASLMNKKPWQKTIIFVGGVIMNFVLAWFLLTLFYLFGGKALIPEMWNYKGVINDQKVFITDVSADSPAAKADLKQGDQIVKADGVTVYSMDTVFLEIQNSPTVKLEIIRDGREVTQELTSQTQTVKGANGQDTQVQMIGITMEETGKIRAVWYKAPFIALAEVGHVTKLTLVGFYEIFKTLFTKFQVSENVGGPIAIAKFSGVAASLGVGVFIQFLAILSISLGILNIIPFPALDGGHVMFLAVEKFMGRPISEKVKGYINTVGFGLILLLAAVIAFHDLARFGILNIFKR